ncbi:hypothetical protein [Chryseobacterium sp. SC28]|uniref:hypothetical protein n=1 Tax=Chryseobacterium sp. SC28 TaxID=2268028 RepID=UPI000F64A467|nr:hypothetical protein [Chryseobacterium sp. SC28]RRQ46087.1 hypothetical protein DTW91_07360 [Chryseobacterium sp. SC28]
METPHKNIIKKQRYRPFTATILFPLSLGCVLYAFSDAKIFDKVHKDTNIPEYSAATFVGDSIRSVEAFAKVYKVLQSPRCVNCHPAGDIPLQGDDRKLHAMHPRRGEDGKGVLTMKCTNCHQPENTPGIHTPPGNPKWHLPPANMKMVFEGKKPHELAKQLKDPAQNGNKDVKALIAHADDDLVLWGWKPGEGRTLPPYSHKEFKEAWITWLKTGAYAPAE